MKILKESSDYLEKMIISIDKEVSETNNEIGYNKKQIEDIRTEKYNADIKRDDAKKRMDSKIIGGILTIIVISLLLLFLYSIYSEISILLFAVVVLPIAVHSSKNYYTDSKNYRELEAISDEKSKKIEDHEKIIRQLNEKLANLNKKSNDYSKGLIGEKKVTEMLKNIEHDDSYLINDITLDKAFGNIDHILVSKYGIFIIETKNWDGEICCNGDNWSKHYDENLFDLDIESISKRIKGNARNLRLLLETNLFKNLMAIWIEGIIVFANTNAEIKVINPAVPVLTIGEMNDYIKRQRPQSNFSSRDLESIANFILRAITHKENNLIKFE